MPNKIGEGIPLIPFCSAGDGSPIEENLIHDFAKSERVATAKYIPFRRIVGILSGKLIKEDTTPAKRKPTGTDQPKAVVTMAEV